MGESNLETWLPTVEHQSFATTFEPVMFNVIGIKLNDNSIIFPL